MQQVSMAQSINTNWLLPSFDVKGEYDQLPCAAFVLNNNQHVLQKNSRAESILNNQDGVYLSDNHLHFNDHLVMNEFETLIDECVNHSIRSVVRKHRLLPVKRTNRQLPYQLIALSANNVEIGSRTVVLIHDPLDAMALRTNLLSDAYDLTVTEIRVCRHFYAGHPMTKICELMGIKANTAKTHFRHIFDKCQVSSRIELMRLLSCFNTPWYLSF